MRKVKTTVAVIVLGAVIVGVLLYFTLRSEPSGGNHGEGVFQGVTAAWCSGRGGDFVPNVPAGGGPDLGSCTVGNTPQGS